MGCEEVQISEVLLNCFVEPWVSFELISEILGLVDVILGYISAYFLPHFEHFFELQMPLVGKRQSERQSEDRLQLIDEN